ncbi:MAG: hypothetical protein MZV65_52850 [Chromatiales bacterium]|nr:hypothetical protein [Chromatiales bacterium]
MSRLQLRLASTGFVVLLAASRRPAAVAVARLPPAVRLDPRQPQHPVGGHRAACSRALDRPVHDHRLRQRDRRPAQEHRRARRPLPATTSRTSRLEFVDPNLTRHGYAPPTCASTANWWSRYGGRTRKSQPAHRRGVHQRAGAPRAPRRALGGVRQRTRRAQPGPHRRIIDLSTWAAQLDKRGIKTRQLAARRQHRDPREHLGAGDRRPAGQVPGRPR